MLRPDLTGPYYTARKAGGYSPCILGNNSSGQRYCDGSVLPNCVGWAWGRFHEVASLRGFSFWAKGDARTIYDSCRLQGLRVGHDPKPGGIMVWDNGGAGHAAFVESCCIDGAPVCSESGWYFTGDPVRWITRRGKDYRIGCAWMDQSYRYVGCVYHPCIKDVAPVYLQDMDSGVVVQVPGIYQSGRNYVQLSALADAGYVRAGWDKDRQIALIGVK